MANPNPPPPPASHRFTTSNAASYGARGAAERERRILHRVPSPKARERARRELEAEQRRQLRVALWVVHACFGPPWRPRSRPPRRAIETLLPDAVHRPGTAIERLYREEGDRLWRAVPFWSGDREIASDRGGGGLRAGAALRRGDP
jgi:hypothetical protein